MATAPNLMRPIAERGWQRGFGNLFRNENGLRWGRLRWIRPMLIWVALLNGFVLLVAFGAAQDDRSAPAGVAVEGVAIFMTIGTIATAVGGVIGVQGAIIREKQLGTAAWVLSKPASRHAFVLAKLASHLAASLGLSLAVPAVIFFVQSQWLWKQVPAVLPFLGGWLVMALHLLFYLAFTLMLGTLFSTRGPVAGLGLGLLFGGQILPNFMPAWAILIFPWKLSELAPMLALGQPLPPGWPIPVIATGLWTGIIIAVALWRFGREEF